MAFLDTICLSVQAPFPKALGAAWEPRDRRDDTGFHLACSHQMAQAIFDENAMIWPTLMRVERAERQNTNGPRKSRRSFRPLGRHSLVVGWC